MNEISNVNESFRTLPIYTNTPFDVEGIKRTIRTTKEDEQKMVDPDTGEYLYVRRIPKTNEVLHDTFTYTKIFHTKQLNIKGLSTPAFYLFYYITQSLRMLQDSICIDEDVFLNEYGYSKGSRRLYYKAALELIDAKIIAKRAGSSKCFWINPNIIFNGNRIKLYKEEK